jgi:hypothetical protein
MLKQKLSALYGSVRCDWFQSISSIFENDVNRETMESDVYVEKFNTRN